MKFPLSRIRVMVMVVLTMTLGACSNWDIQTQVMPNNTIINQVLLDMSESGKITRDKERIAELYKIATAIAAYNADKNVYPAVPKDECVHWIQKDIVNLLPKISEDPIWLWAGLCPNWFSYKLLTKNTGEIYPVLATRLENQNSMNFDGTNWNALSDGHLGTQLINNISESDWYYVIGLNETQRVWINDDLRFSTMLSIWLGLRDYGIYGNLPKSPRDQCLWTILQSDTNIMYSINTYPIDPLWIPKLLNIPTGTCSEWPLYKIISSFRNPEKQIIILWMRAENKKNANFDGSNWDNIDENTLFTDDGIFKIKRGTVSVVTDKPQDWYMVYAKIID